MGEKRQIFEESQIIYVGAPPSRRWSLISSLPLEFRLDLVTCLRIANRKGLGCEEWGNGNNFTVKKPTTYHQVL